MHPLRLHFAGILLLLSLLLGNSPANAQQQEVTTTTSYVVRFKPASEVETIFAPLVADFPQINLSIDNARGRVVLSGPVWAHDLMDQILDRIDQPPGAPTDPAQPIHSAPPELPASPTNNDGPVRLPKPNAIAPPAASDISNQNTVPSGETTANRETTRRMVPLPPGEAIAVRKDVLSLLGKKLEMKSETSSEWLFATPSGPLRIEFDLNREDVFLDGPVNAVDQFSRLLTALTQRHQTQRSGQMQSRVLMLKRDVQPQLKQMLDTSRPDRQSQPEDLNAKGASSRLDHTRQLLRLAGLEQQTAPAQQAPEDADSNIDPLPDNNGERNRLETNSMIPSLPQLEGVEVETLPDLDAIILRGRDQDLDQLADIIRQLEQLSRETQPAIEIILLRHSRSIQVSELIQQTQQGLIGTRQGRAVVTPLGKPNAMLLIGWGEAVVALKELITKLDRPVDPETQFNIFRIKHATAATIQQAITTFFAQREGAMTPTIQSTVDQRTNSLIVHAAPRDMLEVARLVERLDTMEGSVVKRTRVFPIQNSLAADIADTLQQAIAGTGSARTSALELLLDESGSEQKIVSGILDDVQITVDARKNNLIISAPAENFELIEALIRKLDSPGTIAKIKIFAIENGDAASLIQTLRALLPSQVGTDPVGSAQLSSAPGESALTPLRFTADVRSNSIIASGSEGDLTIVDALLMRLDEADAMQRQNTVYQLKNSPAVDVALAVNEFLVNTRRVETAAPGTINPFAQLEKEVVVVPEPVSNKLIVSATPRYFDEISKLIEKLDEQPPQVMIQALIAEVILGDAEEFGVELGIQDSVLFDRSLLGDLLTVTSTTQNSTAGGVQTNTQETIVAATNEPGFNFNNSLPLGNSGSANALANAAAVGGQAISNFAVGRGSADLGFGGLILSASSNNVNVLLRALQESRRTEVLSRPQVLTLDNQPAFIQVGQRVPRITGSSINQVGQQNTVALENVGLILAVTPRISPEGNVTMEIDAEKSSVGPESEGIPVSVSADGTIVRSPRVDVASAQATVSAADGETIILGGLITNDRKQVHRKVPYLGDVPLLKYLFRFDSVSNRRAELLIILTPHIIRSKTDMERLKQTEMARMHWCAGDVFDLHGEIISGPHHGSLFGDVQDDAGLHVVYPHEDPRAQKLNHKTAVEKSVIWSDPSVITEPIQLPNQATMPEPIRSQRFPTPAQSDRDRSSPLNGPQLLPTPSGESQIYEAEAIREGAL